MDFELPRLLSRGIDLISNLLALAKNELLFVAKANFVKLVKLIYPRAKARGYSFEFFA